MLYYVHNGQTDVDPKTAPPAPPVPARKFPVRHRITVYLAIVAGLVFIAFMMGVTWAAFAASAISGSHDGLDRLADFLTRS